MRPRHPFYGHRRGLFFFFYLFLPEILTLPFPLSFVYRLEDNMQDDFQHIAISIRPRLVSLCRSFFGRQELAYDAEDAVQETLLRLWQIRDRLDGYQCPEALAVKIAKNVCIDMLRQAGIQHDTLDDTVCAFADMQSDHQAIAHDAERIVGHAMATLSATERRMLIMRGEGMTMKEIAAACCATPDSVKTMICAARKQLMTTLNIRRKRK